MDKESGKNKKKSENKPEDIKEEHKKKISEVENRTVKEEKKAEKISAEKKVEKESEEKTKSEETPAEKPKIAEAKPQDEITEAEEEIEIKDEEKEQKEEIKPAKSEDDTKKPKKKVDEDFRYIVRIANTDIDGNKNVVHGLTTIKGVGMKISNFISDKSGIDKNMKIGDLSDSQIEKIRKSIDEIEDNAPVWMLNHRKDYETGEDIHIIGSDIDMRLRDEVNIMKKVRSYRGIRHERGLRVRGQRTRANNRKGLALGVSKKRETQT